MISPMTPSKRQWKSTKIIENNTFCEIFQDFHLKLFLLIQGNIFPVFLLQIRV